jgi:hypothetical protein
VSRTTDLADPKLGEGGLGQHLVVEDEVVAIGAERQFLQYFTRESPISGVVLAELLPHQQVLKGGEETIENVFVAGHPPPDRAAPEDARGEHDIVNAAGDHSGHRRDQPGGVLIIRVHHNDDIGAALQRLAIAGLLIRAIAAVFGMDDMVQAQLLGHVDRPIPAGIVHQDYVIHHVPRNFLVGAPQGELRIVGGHDDSDFFVMNHRIRLFECSKGP